MNLQRDIIDEIDGTSRWLVEVPIPGSHRRAYIMFAVFSLGSVPALVGVLLYITGSIEALIESLLLLPIITLLLGVQLLVSLKGFRDFLVLASRPDFAVGKDGLLLSEGRSQSHYDREEVWYCHWSHYEPGVLNIQVGGSPALPGVSLGPTRLFRHIPEAYQAEVEKAIRAMGKWAEGESDWALVQEPSRGDDSSGLKMAAIDEFDGTQVALVEVPYSRWKLVASFFPALLWICWGWICLGATMFGPVGPIFFGCGCMAVVVAVSALSRANRPEFAVFKEGIWLPFDRSFTWSSPSRIGHGLFAWDKVSYCRWSRYTPGILEIQVTSTPSRNKFRLPPTRLEYRVSEEYRPSVETAIRAMGKWAE